MNRLYNFFIGRAVVLIVILMVVLVTWLVYRSYQISQINSYTDCATAGYPILETYPEQCRANGHTYVKQY